MKSSRHFRLISRQWKPHTRSLTDKQHGGVRAASHGFGEDSPPKTEDKLPTQGKSSVSAAMFVLFTPCVAYWRVSSYSLTEDTRGPSGWVFANVFANVS